MNDEQYMEVALEQARAAGAAGDVPVGAIVVIDDAIAIRSMLYVSMSYDHRVVDGAVADQFLAMVQRGLENFDESLL